MKPGFELAIEAADGHARTGIYRTPHGVVPTPAFMPVGTAGAVKTLAPDEVAGTGARMILGNTYHLMLRPGHELIKRAGGLHAFMAWPGSSLTDSGGYQVFSLGDRAKVRDEGVTFQSHVDGTRFDLTPEFAMEVEQALGADVAMVLDECPPGGAARDVVERAVRRSTAWARRCLAAHTRSDQALFGIVQGAAFLDLRRDHAAEISAMGFDGHALGGLSVGEPKEAMQEVIREVAPTLPADRPRYLMGVGTEEDLLFGMAHGIDLFDCVLPTRNARNGQAFTRAGRLAIKQARFREDPRPLDETCDCAACRTFDRRYLRHLFMIDEILAHRMLTLHNLRHFGRLMAGARDAIRRGELEAYSREVLAGLARGIDAG
jgi:queuine tRNA-ribosyltransferase